MVVVDQKTQKDYKIQVHHDGYIWYESKDFTGNQISRITTEELSRLSLCVGPEGERYVQKGGQRRLYIDNAQVTDRDNVSVRDYLSKQDPHKVTVTVSVTLNAPDEEFAVSKAKSIVEPALFVGMGLSLNGNDVHMEYKTEYSARLTE